VTGGGAHPADGRVVEAYLAAVAARLPGPGRARAAALAELRDGLDDAVDAARARGAGPGEAARVAVAESGPADVVAAAFAPLLADLWARRAALALLATGPVVGLLWVSALTPGEPPPVLLRGAPPLAMIVVAAAAAGLLAVAATGRWGRRLPDLPALPQLAAAGVCAAAVCADATVLTLAVSRALGGAGALPVALLVAAATASTARLAWAQYAARRCLRAAGAARA